MEKKATRDTTEIRKPRRFDSTEESPKCGSGPG
jgi:hypothetical protein